LGGAIRARRRARRLTLRALATAAGCSASYLSQIENGARASPPGEDVLARLEGALGLEAGELRSVAAWLRTPREVRRQVERLADQRAAARRLALLLRGAAPAASSRGSKREGGAQGSGAAAKRGRGGAGGLDALYRSGELRRLIERLDPGTAPGAGGLGDARAIDAWPGGRSRGGGGAPASREVPLINSVAAGYPAEFTDLGYPARVADEYVRTPDVTDPDAFAARVVGDSMMPEYREGDIVVFSPARPVRSGMDCFARLEPDHESTFKRVYFETGAAGEALIRLQPLNPAYPARVVGREEVAGLYAAVSVTRPVGGPPGA
jgi:SOS-response transcriptional repressor LexA